MTCNGTSECTSHSTILAVDTSHLCSLGRLANKAQQPAVRFDELVAWHNCGGQRQLLTSATLMDCEMNLADANCSIRLHAGEVHVDALDSFVVKPHDLSHAEALAEHVCESPQGNPIPLVSRDATLVAVAERCATELDENVAVVSDDERLLRWLDEMLVRGITASLPLAALRLLSQMVYCGALTPDDFLAAAEAEAAYHANQGSVQWIQETKQSRIQRLVNAVAKFGDSQDE